MSDELGTVTAKIKELEEELRGISCGDSSCIMLDPKGQCTNGGCRCLYPYTLTPPMRIKIRRAFMIRREQVKLYQELVSLYLKLQEQ